MCCCFCIVVVMTKVAILRPNNCYFCFLLIIVRYSLKKLRKEAQIYKSRGNDQFKVGGYQESAKSYTLGLRTCPLAFDKDRAVMYSNRAAAKVKLVSVFVFNAVLYFQSGGA